MTPLAGVIREIVVLVIAKGNNHCYKTPPSWKISMFVRWCIIKFGALITADRILRYSAGGVFLILPSNVHLDLRSAYKSVTFSLRNSYFSVSNDRHLSLLTDTYQSR